MDRSTINNEGLIGTGIGSSRVAVTWERVDKGETFSLVETDIKLVAMQDIERAFVIESLM